MFKIWPLLQCHVDAQLQCHRAVTSMYIFNGNILCLASLAYYRQVQGLSQKGVSNQSGFEIILYYSFCFILKYQRWFMKNDALMSFLKRKIPGCLMRIRSVLSHCRENIVCLLYEHSILWIGIIWGGIKAELWFKWDAHCIVSVNVTQCRCIGHLNVKRLHDKINNICVL